MKSPSHGPEPCASANSAISACAKFDNKDMIAYLMENVKRFFEIFHKHQHIYNKKNIFAMITKQSKINIA